MKTIKLSKSFGLLLCLTLVEYSSQGQNAQSAIKSGAESNRQQDDSTAIRLDEVEITGLYPMNQLVGEYQQPAWTLVRKFPATRVYLMTPPGTNMYEKWVDMRVPRSGPAEVRFRDEFAFGLGKRLELDLYLHTVLTGPPGEYTFGWRGFSWEVRYALADWGKLFGNPTLYFEHKILNGKMGIEPKLLLGDNIGSRGIWGLNFIYEAYIAEARAEQEREYAATASYGFMLNDDLTFGSSIMYRYNDPDFSDEFYAGPLIQYRLNAKAYVSLESLLGITDDSKSSRNTFIFGWQF